MTNDDKKLPQEQRYGVVFQSVMRNPDLDIEAKGLYAYLSSFAGKSNTAFPSVDLICHELNISDKRFKKYRKQLEEMQLIEVKRNRKDKGFSNNIYTLKHGIVSGQNVPVQNYPITNVNDANSVSGHFVTGQIVTGQNDPPKNNSLKNNSINIKDIVEYLNFKTNKSFKDTSKKTQRYIISRLNEGFTLDDFKTVIDNKTMEWLNDEKMNQYLRPETLFGTKFESYLNAKPINKSFNSSVDVNDVDIDDMLNQLD
ncbi:conserved phage C-terminal domain-containing protein [Macrococcoides goetzii]|nr:conserved phage C-terminal domain-containing protein [Macrococcus goetzii]